jgi:nucleotide-binding universal stress UspA family protein
MLQIDRILAPTDLSSLSLPALRYALEIGLERKAEVVVYHVIEVDYDWFNEDDPRNPASVLVPQRKKKLHEFLVKHFADWLDKPKMIVREAVECGNPHEKIVSKAERENADLVVMATHGRTGLEQLIVGSVTAKVVARAGCPVLSIKPQ